jgi:hypothetical protein
MRDVLVPNECVCRLALEPRLGGAYNEEAFRYLVTIERKRSERSGRTFLLMLVDLEDRPGVTAGIDPTVAAELFSVLQDCLREIDFVGWYHEGRVAGAVLSEARNRPGTDVSRLIAHRVEGALGARLSPDFTRRLRIRVYPDGASENIESGALEYEGAVNIRGV